jgi:serine kinase of HPr protein (carbohydrate metabolism regulator)
MRISEIIQEMNLELLQTNYEDRTIMNGYTSDLLSDVMGNAPDQTALITIQAHKNTIAVAALIDCKLIIICNSKEVEPDMLAAAQKEGIAIVRTTETQFVISGKLYQLLKQ